MFKKKKRENHDNISRSWTQPCFETVHSSDLQTSSANEFSPLLLFWNTIQVFLHKVFILFTCTYCRVSLENLFSRVSLLGLFLNLPGKWGTPRLLSLRDSEKFLVWAANLEQGQAVASRRGTGCVGEGNAQEKIRPAAPETIHVPCHSCSPQWVTVWKYFVSSFLRWNNAETVAIDSSYLYLHSLPR